MGGLSLYDQIVAEVQEAWEDMRAPVAARMSKPTLERLVGEGKGSYTRLDGGGRRFYYMDTPYGRLEIITDKYMPDNKVIVLVKSELPAPYGPANIVVMEVGDYGQEQQGVGSEPENVGRTPGSDGDVLFV